jgi:RNA polymerase sigma factor (sigma-70 family)
MIDSLHHDRSDRFPPTRYSAIRALGSGERDVRRRALHALVDVYWKPVYKYIRLKWQRSGDDARDLTQEFFACVIEKEFLADFDPSKARFRTYLRTVLDRMMNNELKAASRQKRGGDLEVVSLDYTVAERELERFASGGTSAEQQFEIELTRALFDSSLLQLKETLMQQGKEVHYRLFERYDIDRVEQSLRLSYADLAEQFGLRQTDVTNYLALARRTFRAIVLERLKMLTATDDEYRDEVRRLLGINPNE